MNQKDEQNIQKEILFRTKFSNSLNLRWVLSYAVAMVVCLVVAVACLFGKGVIANDQIAQLLSVFGVVFVIGTVLAALLVGLFLLIWLFMALGHKNAFCTEDGVYIAKRPYSGQFLTWDQIERIACEGATKKRTSGFCNFYAKLPDPKQPEQLQETKIQVSEIKYPDALVDFVNAAKKGEFPTEASSDANK